jgi:hypothetical protein
MPRSYLVEKSPIFYGMVDGEFHTLSVTHSAFANILPLNVRQRYKLVYVQTLSIKGRLYLVNLTHDYLEKLIVAYLFHKLHKQKRKPHNVQKNPSP